MSSPISDGPKDTFYLEEFLLIETLAEAKNVSEAQEVLDTAKVWKKFACFRSTKENEFACATFATTIEKG